MPRGDPRHACQADRRDPRLTVVTAVPMTQIHWDGTQASTQADKIDTLLNVMIVLSSFVFAIVLVMLGYCVWKYRAKPGDESDGEPIHGNTKLEITWTVIPTVIVLFGADLQLDRARRHREQGVGRPAASTSPLSSTSGPSTTRRPTARW